MGRARHIGSLAGALGALCALLGSGCPPSFQCTPASIQPGFANLPPDLLLAGQVATVEAIAPQRSQCPVGPDGLLVWMPPTSVVPSLVGPSGAVIPVTARLRGDVADFSFLPPEPGRYHLEAAFGPSLGTLQADFVVAQDRSAEVRFLPSSCARMDRTAAGALLCDDQLLLDGGVVDRLDAGVHLVAGRAVWSFNRTHVWRALETDAGMLTSAAGDTLVDPDAGFTQLIADETSAIVRSLGAPVWTRAELVQLRVTDAGLVETGATQQSDCSDCSPPALGWTAQGPVDTNGLVCGVTFSAQPPCVSTPPVCGFSDGLLWIMSAQSLQAASLGDGGIAIHDALALAALSGFQMDTSAPSGPCQLMSPTAHAYLARWSDAGIVLDTFFEPWLGGAAQPFPTTQRANDHLVWWPWDGGTLYAPR